MSAKGPESVKEEREVDKNRARGSLWASSTLQPAEDYSRLVGVISWR